MVATDHPGVGGTAARLPKKPGIQKLTPPSSARATCGAIATAPSSSAEAATATRRPVLPVVRCIRSLRAISRYRVMAPERLLPGGKLEVQPDEDLPTRHTCALVPNRVLRLDEEIGRGALIDLPHIADAEPDRDEVVVVLEVEAPDRRRPEIPALR